MQLALRLKAQVNGGLHWVKIREFTKNGTYVKLTVKLFLVMFYDIHRGTTLIKGICSFGNWVEKKRNFRSTDIGMHVHCFEASYLPALLK